MEDLLRQISIEPKEFMDHLHEYGDIDNHPTFYILDNDEEEFKLKSEKFSHTTSQVTMFLN